VIDACKEYAWYPTIMQLGRLGPVAQEPPKDLARG
jgi:hypothetical protein